MGAFHPNFPLSYLFEMSVSTVATCNQFCNILQHLQQYTTKSKKLSGQIEPSLSNGDCSEFVWTTVSKLTAAATPCNETFLSFCSEWSFFKAYVELLIVVVVFCAEIWFWDAVSNLSGVATIAITSNVLQQSRFCDVATPVFKLVTSCKIENRSCNVTHPLQTFCKIFGPRSGHQARSADPP